MKQGNLQSQEKMNRLFKLKMFKTFKLGGNGGKELPMNSIQDILSLNKEDQEKQIFEMIDAKE